MFDEEIKVKCRKEVGEQIKVKRTSLGLSVRELSDLCGVTYQNINKIETGHYNASIDVVNKIICSLKCHIKIEENDGRMETD